jgi:mannose-6-phosphate isomerase-like protein (cupin superfamily)
MICRHPRSGLKLDVAGVNEITVLIDRSETERTEVAINAWQPGRDGPPHQHERKEQNFLVLEGHGEVIIGGRTFPATVGSLFFLPAGVVHQTITQGDGPMRYFLFNAFLDADKEGHASFAEHIDQVKHIRRQQADQQRPDVTPLAANAGPARPHLAGRSAQIPVWATGSVVLLPADLTERCEVVLHELPAEGSLSLPANATREQTLYILEGGGAVTIGAESARVTPEFTLFVPRLAPCVLTAGPTGLRLVSFGALVR